MINETPTSAVEHNFTVTPQPEYAFPCTTIQFVADREFRQVNPGMTLRDYFAAKALPVFLAERTHFGDIQKAVKSAYTTADAMLKQRNS